MSNTPAVNVSFTRGGEMGERISSYDWESTGLGSIELWPQSLKIAAQIMLDSRYPMYIAWGEDFTFLYNDAYFKMTLGPKHPWALGKTFREIWAEVWAEVSPRMESVLQTGKPTWDEGLLLFLERRGFPEETYHTFSWSPVPDDTGGIGGLLCVVTEDTDRVISERQLTLLRELAARTADTRDILEACERCAKTLATNPWDIPFAMIYLAEPNNQRMTMVGASGIHHEHPLAPKYLSMNNETWPFYKVLETNKFYLISDLDSTNYPYLPIGVWQRSPNQAALIPIPASGETRNVGFLVIGLNPFRLFDDKYQRFLELAAGQIASSMSNAQAYANERKRAEELAELDRAKTAFFSNVSHEFRTPLTLMLAPIEDVLNDSNTILDNRMRMDIAHRNALRLLKLVNTLLDFSRLEAGRMSAFYVPTDLSALTKELAGNFQSAMLKAGLGYKVTCPTLSEPVYIDRSMWEKIVLNLLSNAFKYTFNGEIEISLKQNNNNVILCVRDTGTGIPEKDISHIFKRFHRIEGAQGKTHEGSGIGLALVQELVKLHGGSVEVQSEYGKGSIFTVRIPLGKEHLPAEHIGNISMLSTTDVKADTFVEEAMGWLPDTSQETPYLKSFETTTHYPASAGARIVLADDNADMRNYVQQLLNAHYRIEAVADGEAALAAIERELPDLVLTDVMMPRLDGFGLLACLRANEQTRNIPIIMLSARAGEEARIEGVEAGANDYLVKPFSTRELQARVNALITTARLRSKWEQDVRERENRLHALVTAISDVVYCMSPDWKEMRHLKGRDFIPDMLEPTQNWLDVYIYPEDQPYVMAAINEAIRTGSIFHLEHRVRQADGNPGWTLSRAVPIRNARGDIIEWFGAASDITKRKQAESALIEARNRADEANKAKSEFLANMSHEIRTPMNAVVGLSNILSRNKLLPKREREFIETLQTSAEQLMTLINDMLDVAKIESKAFELEHITFDPNQLIEDCIHIASVSAKEKNLAIASEQSDIENMQLIGDPLRIRQIITNLLSNAIKFTEEGKITIRTNCSPISKGKVDLIISICDTGIGMTPETCAKIFGKFTQADSSTTRKYGGTGLGLTICKHLAESMGGDISVTSEISKGTEFTVTLPLDLANNTIAEKEITTEKPIDTDTYAFILLVEDQPANILVATTLLEDMRYRYHVVNNGREAIAALEQQSFDLILMDVQMQELDGLETTRIIRKREAAQQKKHIPIIAMTAHALVGDREKCLAAGMDDYISKPFNPNILADTITRNLNQAKISA
jgi:signal transduction histidine kinase/CheY-like chemotaxis protein